MASPEPGPGKEDAAGATVLESYLASAPASQAWMRDVSMDVDIDAKLPRLNKAGRLHALRNISKIGKITYNALRLEGDNTVKKDVIARYLEAEGKAISSASLSVTPENYKFKYYGAYGGGDWKLHLFEVTPKEKRDGLFKGWLWVHDGTGLPVREQGDLVKTPSIFLKKVSFVRDYELRDGVAVPKQIESLIDTRIVGRAELNVKFSNVTKKASLASFNGDLAVFAGQAQ
jgi:hypothetical protein